MIEKVPGMLFKELNIIRKAPLACLVLVLIGMFAGYKAHQFRDADRQAAAQRSLSEAPTHGQSGRATINKAAYERLSNDVLKEEVLQLCREIDRVLRWFESENMRLQHAEQRDRMQAKTEIEQEKLLENYKNQKNELHVKLQQEYEKRFLEKSAVLFEAIVARLPTARRSSIEDSHRDLLRNPTNVVGIKWSANYLEMLAGQLSTGSAQQN